MVPRPCSVRYATVRRSSRLIGFRRHYRGYSGNRPGCPTGRFHIDEISSNPLPSGHTSRRWGTAIKRPDGAVTLDPDPWPDR